MQRSRYSLASQDCVSSFDRAASGFDRLTLVPVVLVPLALAGVFPHLLMAFAILDVTLAIGAWVLFGRMA